MNKSTKRIISDTIASSFVPQIIKRAYVGDGGSYSGTSVKTKHCSLLWIDLCNFSALCNRLMSDANSGVERITQILNTHYDFVLTEISRFGGEPLFFAGDGVMAAWPGEENQMQQPTTLAVACAQAILNNRHTTDDQHELLSFHLMVATGILEMAVLERGVGNKLPTFFGTIFNDIKTGLKNPAPNQILIFNKALALLDTGFISQPLLYNTAVIVQTPAVPAAGADSQAKETPGLSVSDLKLFMPPALSLPVSLERLKWMAEIRPVSTLFVCFTQTSQDSIARFQELEALMALISPLVVKYDGLINQIWIDEKDSQILIYFGPPPAAHTDNQERSVQLGFEVHHLLSSAGFHNSIGISSGEAYCGIIGNQTLRHYTVIGDSVNLSSRLAGISNGIFYCDEATYKATRNVVKYHAPVMQTIKGRKERLRAYKPKLLFGAAVAGQVQTSVGRTSELNRLIQAAEQLLSQNTSTTVFIEAESGMGKSKLLEDFRTHLKDSAILLTAASEFIFRNTPYSTAAALFSVLPGILQSAEAASGQLTFAETILHRYGSNACLLNTVLHLHLPESKEVRSMTSSQKVAQTHNLLLQVLAQANQGKRLVIIADDAHWMDSTTWELLSAASKVLPGLLILTAFQKVESVAQLSSLYFANPMHLVLNGLEKADLKQLICNRLKVENVAPEIVDIIGNTSKGNPFFCIELVDSLMDQQLLHFNKKNYYLAKDAAMDDLSLPQTIRGAIFRRIDRLNQGSQLSLKVGGIIGKRFGKKMARSIYPIAAERRLVPSYLEEAEQSGFINNTIVDEMDGYDFNNETIAQVAYEMTLSEQRKLLHQECARWYEKHFKNNLSPFYIRLVHHWRQAGNVVKAALYQELETLRLFSLGFASQSLDFGLEGVKLLGQQIERNPALIQQEIGRHITFINAFMANKTIDSLTQHKALADEKIRTVIKTLLKLCPIAHQCQQAELFALMAVLSLRLTLEHGNGDAAAESYAMYSIIHKAMTNDSLAAFAWSNLALAVDKKNNHSLRGRIIFVHCWFIAPWQTPLRTLLPMAMQGAEASFKSGDILYGCFNLSLAVVLKSVAGFRLDEVVQTAEKNWLRNNQRIVNAAFHLKHEEQVAKAFQGHTTGYTSLTDEKYEEEKDIAAICQTDLYNQIGYYLVSKLKLNVHFGNWAEALEWGRKALPLLPAFASQPGHIELEQYFTMAALYHAAAPAKNRNQEEWNEAITGIEKMKAWARGCPQNFEHKALLLQAIYEGFTGSEMVAAQCFEQAAAKALEANYLQDVGLCFEHWALMQQRMGNNAQKAIGSAIDAYRKWGAHAKIAYLQQVFTTSE